MLSFIVSSWMISHLGMNPVSGGRPPIESSTAREDDVMIGNLFHVWDRDASDRADMMLKEMNRVSVSKM